MSNPRYFVKWQKCELLEPKHPKCEEISVHCVKEAPEGYRWIALDDANQNRAGDLLVERKIPEGVWLEFSYFNEMDLNTIKRCC